MTDCDWFAQHLDAYELELLDPDASGRFERHLAACEPCRALLEGARIVDERIRLAVAAVEPSESFTRQLAAGARRPPMPELLLEIGTEEIPAGYMAPALEALEAVRKKSERYALRGEAFYFHAPEGFYRSKLGGRSERSLGVAVTGRAWSSVVKVMAMAKAMG